MREEIAWLTAFVFSLYPDIFELWEFEQIILLSLSFPLHKKRTIIHPDREGCYEIQGIFPQPGLNLFEYRKYL